MTEEVRRLLTYARALIEKGWTKGASARNAARASVSEYSAAACAFCTIGALRRAYLDCHAFAGELYAATDALTDQLPARRRGLGRATILQYNDNRQRTKEEILALFDAALKETPQ